MNADMIFKRINSFGRKNACYIFSHVFGVMKRRMYESDLKIILTALEYYEEQEAKESDKEAAFFGRT